MSRPPVIIVRSASASSSISFDCACASSVNSASDEPADVDPSICLIKSELLTCVPMDGEHEVVYHQVKHNGVIVINSTVRQILDFFTSPVR
jgi:hypothetical protein